MSASLTSSSFATFTGLCEEISQLTAHKEKQEAIGQVLRPQLSDLNIFVKLLLPKLDSRKFQLQDKSVIKLFARVLSIDASCIADANVSGEHAGDLPSVIQTLFEKTAVCKTQSSTLTLSEIDHLLEQLSLSGKEDDHHKAFLGVMDRLTPTDLKWLLRIILKDLQTGAGQKQILTGLHPSAYHSFQINSDLEWIVAQVKTNSLPPPPSVPAPVPVPAPVGPNKKKNTSDDDKKTQSQGETKNNPKKSNAAVQQQNKITLMSPFKPMLADACKSYAAASKKCASGIIFADIKYDGERIQVHKNGKTFAFFSRSLKTAAPHKVEHIQQYVPQASTADSLVLDGEILMVDHKTGTPLPFGTLGVHKREKFANASPCYFVFDILYLNGESLLTTPMAKRRQILEDNVKVVGNRIRLSEMKRIENKEDLEDLMVSCIDGGLEGLVLKDSAGVYEPGKRHWLKMKKDYLEAGAMADTADLVVLGGNFGSGRKGSLLSSFWLGCWDASDNKWKSVCKCSNGLDDKQLATLQQSCKVSMTKCGRTAQMPSWLDIKKELMPDYLTVDPIQAPVWEITGAQFSKSTRHSADGISIRFPRITRMRDDKTSKDATDLAQLKKLVAASKLSDTSLLNAIDSKRQPVKNGVGQEIKKSGQVNANLGEEKDQKRKKKQVLGAGAIATTTGQKGSSNNMLLQQQEEKKKKNPAAKKRKCDDEDDANLDARPKCPYGSACYRQNPQHRIDQWHPDNEEEEEDEENFSPPPPKKARRPTNAANSEKKTELKTTNGDSDSKPPRVPVCMFGAQCYQTSAKHRVDYSHPVDDLPSKSSKNAASSSEWGVGDDDDQGEDQNQQQERKQKQEDKEPVIDSVAEDKKEDLPPLPCIFKDVEIYVHGSLDAQILKTIKRFVIAYDGTIGQTCSLSVTHVLTAAPWDSSLMEWVKQYDQIRVVRPEWALDSIQKVKRLNEEPYLVAPTDAA